MNYKITFTEGKRFQNFTIATFISKDDMVIFYDARVYKLLESKSKGVLKMYAFGERITHTQATSL